MRLKKIGGFVATALATILVALFFKLSLPFVAGLTAFVLVLFPFYFKSLNRNQREYDRFVEANLYIEQFLYSFLKTANIRETLSEVAAIADEGRLKKTTIAALNNDYPYGELELIEKEYPLELIETIHHFALDVTKNGGEFSNQTMILLEARRLWEDRCREFLFEKKKHRISIFLSIVTSLFLCSLMYVLTDKISVDIAGNYLVQVVTMLVLMADFVIYLVANRKLSAGLVGKQEIKKTKHMSKKQFTRNLEKEFPRWLMQVALLLESENVQVAIFKSYDTAPEFMKDELDKLINDLRENPTGIEPYIDFYKGYDVPGIASSMKMLYSMSSGFGGNGAMQINEILKQNQIMADRAERLKNEDRAAGMYGLFLAPQITGGLKLLVDMMVMLAVYLGQIGVNV